MVTFIRKLVLRTHKTMKKILIPLAIIISITACKKNSNPVDEIKKPLPPSVVLTKVIINTPGALGFGLPFIKFIYTGKRLDTAKVSTYWPGGGAQATTLVHAFKYDGNNKLMSVKITGQDCQWTDTQVGYLGNDLASLIYSHTGQKKIDYSCIFKNGKLDSTRCIYTNWDYSTKIKWAANGNLLQKNETEKSFGTTKVELTKYLSFDDKNNITQILPLWQYFRENAKGFGWFTPSLNNVLQKNVNGTIRNSTYEYNQYNYPSVSTYIDDNGGDTKSFKYEYQEVK